MIVMVEVEMSEDTELPFKLRSHEEVDAAKDTGDGGTVRLTDLDYWYVYWLHEMDKDTKNEKSHAEILSPIVRGPLAALFAIHRKRIEELREHRVKEYRLKKTGEVGKPLKGRRKPE